MTSINPSIFRAYDIRGLLDDGVNEGSFRLIGRALGAMVAEAGGDLAAVGRDGRLSSPPLAAAIIAGLNDSGIEVLDIGPAPTPTLYYAACRHSGGTGFQITASHNPPQYNGLKAMIGGAALYGPEIQQICRRARAGPQAASRRGRCRPQPMLAEYIEAIADDMPPCPPLRVAIDCGNSIAGILAGDFMRRLGHEAHLMYAEVDGTFPNHHPDPSQAENMRDLAAAVREKQLDLGIAYDGDGDRLGVIDSRGRIIWPDRLMILFARELLARRPGALILYDVKCSRLLPLAIEAAGGRPEMCRTGHSLIKARMRESGAPLAGEMSGHIFFGDTWPGFDDAFYATARLLSALALAPEGAAAALAALPDSLSTPELNLGFEREGEQHRFIDRLRAAGGFAGAEISLIDGLRADFADGWGLVRASNTSPTLVMRFEADDEAALERIQGLFRQRLDQLGAEGIPF